MITIKFSADQVASLGLPHKPAQVQYTESGRLESYSVWLDKQERFSEATDRLIALADAQLPTLH